EARGLSSEHATRKPRSDVSTRSTCAGHCRARADEGSLCFQSHQRTSVKKAPGESPERVLSNYAGQEPLSSASPPLREANRSARSVGAGQLIYGATWIPA